MPMLPFHLPLIRPQHEHFLRLLRLLLYNLPMKRHALPPHIPHQHQSHDKSHTEQNDIHRHRIVLKCAVSQGVETLLGEVQEASEADYQAVDLDSDMLVGEEGFGGQGEGVEEYLAERSEPEDFCAVVGDCGVV